MAVVKDKKLKGSTEHAHLGRVKSKYLKLTESTHQVQYAVYRYAHKYSLCNMVVWFSFDKLVADFLVTSIERTVSKLAYREIC